MTTIVISETLSGNVAMTQVEPGKASQIRLFTMDSRGADEASEYLHSFPSDESEFVLAGDGWTARGNEWIESVLLGEDF